MTPYISKQYTIWHFGLIFCNQSGFENFGVLPDDIIFKGRFDQMPDQVAESIAEIHPNAIEYFEHAMMTLFRGYTPATRIIGTESAKLAIKTRMSKRDAENECTHILIWWIKKTSL